MGSNDDAHGKGWYMHSDYDESQVLYGRVTAAAGRHKNAEDTWLWLKEYPNGKVAIRGIFSAS